MDILIKKYIYLLVKISYYIYLITITGFIFFVTLPCHAINDIGTLGGDQSKANTVSPDGLTAVGESITPNNQTHAFKYKNGIMLDLGTLGGDWSTGNAISEFGTVTVGTSSLPGNASWHAFMHTDQLGMFDLGTLGGNSSEASAISADHSVIIGSSFLNNGHIHAFKYKTNAQISPQGELLIIPQGPMIDLGTLGGTFSIAIATSYDGHIIVGNSSIWSPLSQPPNNSPEIIHAFKYIHNNFEPQSSVMLDLGTLGGLNSKAFAVSANGEVTVGASINTEGEYHAFMHTPLTGMLDLGTLGGDHSEALAVSALGNTVVGSSTTHDGWVHAFKYTHMTGMRDLGTLGGLTSHAVAVSFDGTIVAGNSETNHLHPYIYHEHPNASNAYTHGFIHSDQTGMIDIGTLGGAFSIITGMSLDGEIVVGYSETSVQTVHAFIHKINLPHSQTAQRIRSNSMTRLGQNTSPTSLDSIGTHTFTLMGQPSGLLSSSPPGQLPLAQESTLSSPSTQQRQTSQQSTAEEQDIVPTAIQLVDIDNTAQVLDIEAQNLSSVLANNQTELVESLASDCTTFGQNGICLNAGGKILSTKNSIVSQTISNIGIAFKLLPNLRVGIELDKELTEYNSQYKIRAGEPITTLYCVWDQYAGKQGTKIRVAGTQKSSDVKITRTKLPYTEQGKGDSKLTGLGIEALLSYGFTLAKNWILCPRIGLRNTKVVRKSYQESTAIDFPIDYNRSNLHLTTLETSASLEGFINNWFAIQLVGKVEKRIRYSYKGYAGTIPYLGSFNYPFKLRKAIYSVGAGTLFILDPSQTLQLQVSYGNSMFHKINNLIVTLNYNIGF